MNVRSPSGKWPEDYSTDDQPRTALAALCSNGLAQLKSLLPDIPKLTPKVASTTASQPPSLAWHPREPLLAAIDDDGGAQVFDFSGQIPLLGQSQASLPPTLPPALTLRHDLQRSTPSSPLAWRPHGGRSLAVGTACGVCLWQADTPSSASLVWLPSAGGVGVDVLAWHPQGHMLAGASLAQPGFFVWDVATGTQVPVRVRSLAGK